MISASTDLKSSGAVEPLSLQEISRRVEQCQRLPSLSSTNAALRELLDSDSGYTHQISDVIRRDPSLTSRVLRLVNSVYYGLPRRVTSIEQAVLYLGVRQVRQLVVVTPFIEQFHSLTANTAFTWKLFWQHCISTAMISHELMELVREPQDDLAYISGLLHDVGKIVMASAFPNHFRAIRTRLNAGEQDLLGTERDILGIDHAELGALYLEGHTLPEGLALAARHHHAPENQPEAKLAAAVQLADLLVRNAKIGHSGNPEHPGKEQCLEAAGWSVLMPGSGPCERSITWASLNHTLANLPMILDSLV